MGSAAKWDDATSYSRGEPEPRVSRAWRLTMGLLGVDVHRHRDYAPTTWLMSCYALNIRGQQLKATDVDDAKHEALASLLEKLDRMAADVRKAMGE